MCIANEFPTVEAEAVAMVKAKYGWADDLSIESKWVPPGGHTIVIYFSYNDRVTEYWNTLRIRKRSDGSYNPDSEQCVRWMWDCCVDLETDEVISDARSPHAHGL